MQSLISFFGANEFVPHGYCLAWSPALLWLHVLSDALIVLAYYSIPVTLIYFVRHRRDLPYPGLFVIFGLFIVACGTTHLLSLVTVWIPLYWLDGMVKAVTAAVSVCAAFMTYWVVPRALQLRSPTQLEADVRDKSRKLVTTIAELKETEAALQVSEQRLKLAVASGRVGIWDYHLQTNELIWDDTMFALYGIRREAFSGTYEAWSSRLHPDDKLHTEQAWQAAIAGTRDYNPEFRVIWPTGEVRHIKGHASVIRDEYGKPVRMIGTNWDNFEHAAALHKLQLAHAAINHSKSSYFWFNRQGEVVDVNDYACRSLGYGREELIGRKLWEFDPDYPAESWHSDWLENRKKGVRTFESRHRRKDGTVFPVEITTNYLAVDNEEYGFSFTLDISERKRAEQAIQESRNQLSTLIRTIPDLIWLKNTQGVYLFCNSRFENYFGAAERDIVGKTDYDFVPRELADAFLANDRLAMRKGGSNSHEKWFTFANDGHKELLEVTKTPLLDAEGNNVGVIGIGHNITRRKHTEDALYFIAQRGWLEGEENFFTALAHYLGTTLGAECVLIERLGEDPFLAKTAAAYVESGSPVASSRSLLGTPAEHVNGVDFICHRQGVRRLFPDDNRLAEFGAESFAGILLRDSAGHKIGLIAVIQRKPIVNEALVEQLLKIMATRAAAEMERERSNRLLSEREQEFYTLSENMPDNVFRFDRQGRLRYINPAVKAAIRPEYMPVIGQTLVESYPDEASMTAYQQMIERVLDSGESCDTEIAVPHPSGRTHIHHVLFVAEYDGGGKVVGALGIGRDITERKRAEENLRLIASVFDNSQEAILIADKNNNIVDVNPAFTHITGYSRDEVLGRNPKFLSSGRQDNAFYRDMWHALSENGVWRGEIWNRRKSGEVYAELLSVSAIRDDKGCAYRYVGIFSDISYLKEHEAELSRVAHYDSLTGVPNRLLLADRIKLAIAQAARDHHMVAVCYLDLDGFKAINDSMGHEAGDQVLIDVARRIEHTLRGGDTVARLGGDEFVVLLRLEKDHECIVSLERLLAVIAHPIGINGESHSISASIGVSLYPQDDGDADTLLRHADQAMYVAKQSGKNSFYIYDPALDLRTRSHKEFLKGISEALACNQFEMFYQPKIHLRSGRLVGVEALIRWRHPERGVLSPVEFLRQIENTGLDIEIGNWVIATTIAQIDAWRSDGFAVEVSINISAYHLESPGFADYLRGQMALFDIPPGSLQIEVLETAALTDMAVVREIIEQCRAFGVGFALDDFGTGYSSLSYLSRLPVDVLKIDQSFVRDMLEDNGDKTIVQGIIALARAFGREIVAEGIETDEHGWALLEMGCEIGQGYGIARPMDVKQLKRWYQARTGKDSCVDMV